MNWIYTNNSDNTVLYRGFYWKPGDVLDTPYPVPASLGLTCVQHGSLPDPVLFHDDLIIQSRQNAVVEVNSPLLSNKVALDINCMTAQAGVECYFNSLNNKPIPIDVRGFSQVIDWAFCSKIFLLNPTDLEVIVSITAIEVVS